MPFFFLFLKKKKTKKDKVSAYRCLPNTSPKRGIAPSAPGGTWPRRDNVERVRNHTPQHGAPSARPRRNNLPLAETRPRKNWVASAENRLPSSAPRKRARPSLPVSSVHLHSLRSSCFLQAVPSTLMGGHQGGVNSQLGASPQRESVSDDFQSPTIQVVERAKVEVAHHDVGADPGANLAANPCHHGLHRVTTTALDSCPRTRQVVVTAVEWPHRHQRAERGIERRERRRRSNRRICEGGLAESGKLVKKTDAKGAP